MMSLTLLNARTLVQLPNEVLIVVARSMHFARGCEHFHSIQCSHCFSPRGELCCSLEVLDLFARLVGNFLPRDPTYFIGRRILSLRAELQRDPTNLIGDRILMENGYSLHAWELSSHAIQAI